MSAPNYGLTSVVILTFNQLAYTKLCIESIRKHTTQGSYEVIVVDNASTDGTVDWLQAQPDLLVIINEENVGFPAGCNQGITAAHGDAIMLLNNDTIVTPGWLVQLRQALDSDVKIGAVGPVTNQAAYYSKITTDYVSMEELEVFASAFNVHDPRKWEERLKLIGYCLLFKREAAEEVGLLDEQFTPGNYEDDDYCMRIRQAGYKLLLCKDTFIHHFGSASFGLLPQAYGEALKENERKFAQKWHFNPQYSTNIRMDLLTFIDRPALAPLRVLEVGCGCGATLLEIKNRYPHAELYGVELNEHAAAIAALTADVQAGNIETLELGYADGFFDYVIFGDVLEHLYDPLKLLTRLSPLLKEDGSILASIPNVMHYSLIRQLLYGYWTYTDNGLLDRTHVRFFTLIEMIRLFQNAGFQGLSYHPVVTELSEADQAFIIAITKLVDERMWDQYSAYQYLIEAKKVVLVATENDEAAAQELKRLMRRVEWKLERDVHAGMIMDMLSSGTINYKLIGQTLQYHMVHKEEILETIAAQACVRGLAQSSEHFIALVKEATV